MGLCASSILSKIHFHHVGACKILWVYEYVAGAHSPGLLLGVASYLNPIFKGFIQQNKNQHNLKVNMPHLKGGGNLSL